MAIGAGDNQNGRDIILMSFIPCGAKLPIILTFTAMLNLHFLIIFFIYAYCIGLGHAFRGKAPKKNCDSCNACKDNAFTNTLQFLKRITGPILIFAPILYILNQLGVLYHITNVISPLFAPIGLGHPYLIIAILFGFLGKELTLATLVTLTLPPLSTATQVSLLLFIILSPPCINALFAIKDRSLRGKIFFLTFIAAYITSFVIYWLFVLL